jgi:hypothetical protein
MTIDNLTCFGCGGKGHVERNCPSAVVIGGGGDAEKPMWCGRCDRRTRLVTVGGMASRCQECHPLSHLPLPQHARCPGCRQLIYKWDENLCGMHNSPVKPFDSRPEREEIDAIVAKETTRRYDPQDAA